MRDLEDLTREEQLAIKARIRPKNDRELWWYLKFFWNIEFPTKCHEDCQGKCTAPFKILADAFFARYPVIVLKGSRGSGKSALLGTLALTEQVALNAEVLVLGGSETQAKVVFGYISQKTTRFLDKFWNSPNAPRALKDEKEELTTVSTIVTGGRIKCLPASETSIYGQRPLRLRIDEADLCNIDLIDGALPCAHPQGDLDQQILISSTHYYPDGTLSKLIERFEKQNEVSRANGGEDVIPIYQVCYKDVLETNGGYLTQKMLSEMKAYIDPKVWVRQYENGEPTLDDAIFSDEDLDAFFSDGLGRGLGFEGKNMQAIDIRSHVDPDLIEGYYTGCDFGDKKDWTIVTTCAIMKDESQPDVLIHWKRMGRIGLHNCVLGYDKILNEFEGPACHDGTACTEMASDILENPSKGIIWTKKIKQEMLTSWIAAVEQKKIRCPRIAFLEKDMRNLTWDQCYGKAHLPDSIASFILAWHARNRMMRTFNIDGYKY